MLLSGNGTPKGAARLRVGDAVFLKTIRGSWLHGTVVCLLDTGFGLSGPGLAGIRRIDYRDVTEIQKTALAGELYKSTQPLDMAAQFQEVT